MKPAPYGPFPYSPIIRRPRLAWLEGARVALWATGTEIARHYCAQAKL
jgi:hypothetical protein